MAAEDNAQGDVALPPSLPGALARFRDSLAELIDVVESGGAAGLGGLELVEVFREFEQVRNRMALVDHRLLSEAERQGLATQLTHKNVKAVLVQVLRLSPGEATRRVRAAAAVSARQTMLGEELPPLLPHLAAMQRSGEVSAEQVSVVERAMDYIDKPGLDPVAVEQAERLLAHFARDFGPTELRRIAGRVVDAVHPDGSLPVEQLCRDRRDLTLSPLEDGSWRLQGRLTPSLGAQLAAVLTPLAKPRLEPATLEDGRVVELEDPRHHGQRLHDALEDCCGRLLRTGGLPASGGTPATVIVTIDLDNLLNRVGRGTTSDGTSLPAAEVLRLANEAEILPAVLSTSGVLLELGRSRRVANQNQTYALIARDGGCSFPACSHPPEYCDRHHVREWVLGGRTDVKNLTLLCRYHHTRFAGHGWTCRINDQQLPEWVPPVWVDPEQRPMLNARIRAAHTLAA